MDKLTRTLFVASVATLLGTLGCEDTQRPDPPPPPPKIGIEEYRQNGDAKHKLESDEVYDVYLDSRGRLWFATDDGVSMRAGPTMTHFDPFDGIPNPLCRAIGELHGKIYVGTWGGGAAVFNDTTWTPLPVRNGTAPGLIDGKVSAIVSDGSSLWIGTVNGVSQYFDTPGLTESQRWVNQTPKMNPSRIVSRMLFQPGTSRGNEVWIATKDGGITVIRPTSSTRYTSTTTGLPQNDVNGIAYSEQDTLFWTGMATQCVASVDVDRAVWKHLTTVDGFESNLVTGVAVRSVSGNPEVWVAAQTGITLIKADGTVVNYIGGSGLPSTRLRNILTTSDGAVWGCFIGAGAGKITSPY